MSVRHPLTLRERAWLAAQLRTLRGRGLRPGDQIAIDAATTTVAGVALGQDGKLVDVEGINPTAAASLELAVAVLERVVRARRRETAAADTAPWAIGAQRHEEHALRLLRRVRNAAIRAGRAPAAG